MSDLASLEERARAELAAATDEASLRAWHTKYFGKEGEVPEALKKIGKCLQSSAGRSARTPTASSRL